MTHTITISKRAFTVEPRYVAGHILNDNEAGALNQTFYENLRNNFAKQATEGASQEDFDKYAAAYKFGVRVGGSGPTRDPVQAQAIAIAKDRVKAQIQKLGKKLSDFKTAQITKLAEGLLAKDASILELAKQRVAEMQELASAELDESAFTDILDGAAADGAVESEVPEAAAADDAGAEDGASARKGRKG